MNTRICVTLATGFGLSAFGWTPPGAGWLFNDTGPDERTWTQVALVTNADLSTSLVTNSIIALSTGRNRETNGVWLPAEPELLPVEGGVWCRGARIEAFLAANLNTRGAIQILNNGRWTKLNLLGLAYQDTNGATVWLATVQDCEATIASSHAVVYAGAFSSATRPTIAADVRYQYGAGGGLREDILLRSRPGQPQDYQLSHQAELLVVRTDRGRHAAAIGSWV